MDLKQIMDHSKTLDVHNFDIYTCIFQAIPIK